MWNSLLLMRNLHILICSPDVSFRSNGRLGTLLGQLLLENAATLRVLVLPKSCDFPVARFVMQDSTAVLPQFPCLESLSCATAYSTMIMCCPRLRSLACDEVLSSTCIRCLDMRLVTSLRLESLSLESVDMTLYELASSIADLYSLFRLHLGLRSRSALDCHPLISLFRRHFARLSDLSLDVRSAQSMDKAVHHVSRRNALLQHVQLRSMKLSDASLRSLSRLPRLRRVSIASSDATFSVDAVARLVRSPSVVSAHISCGNQLDQRQLVTQCDQQDVGVMLEETDAVNNADDVMSTDESP